MGRVEVQIMHVLVCRAVHCWTLCNIMSVGPLSYGMHAEAQPSDMHATVELDASSSPLLLAATLSHAQN